MREMSVQELRMDQRFQVRWPIHILAADGSKQGETEDISLGGAFIRCEKSLRPNEKGLLTFQDDPSNRVVLAKAVWTNGESQGSGDKTTGMGVQFLQFFNNQRSIKR